MRLIDADALVKYLLKNLMWDKWGIRRMLDAVGDAETVDAEPVRHGRWVPTEFDGYADGYPVWDTWECSECRDEQYGNDIADLLHYCPNCGAKMDEVPRKKEETE